MWNRTSFPRRRIIEKMENGPATSVMDAAGPVLIGNENKAESPA